MKTTTPWVLLAIGIGYSLLYAACGGLDLPLHHDEKHYLRVAVQFSQSWWPSRQLLLTYPELNTPLPFLLGGWMLRVMGPGIYPLRLLMFILSFLTVSILGVFSRNQPRRFGLCMVGLGLFPYFFFCSVLFYTDMLALFLLVVGVVAYQRSWHGLAALSFALAISTRQFMVVFPLAILLYETIAYYLPYWQATSWRATYYQFRYALLYAAAAATLGGWVWFWDGLAPAAEMARQQFGSHTQLIDVGFMVYGMACLGLYGAVVEAVLFRKGATYLTFIHQNPRSTLVLLGGLAVVVALWPARQHINTFAVVPHMGPLDHALMQLSVPFWGRQLVYWALAGLCLCRLRMDGFTLLTACWLLNVLLMGKTQIAWDKYLMPAIMVFWLLNLTANTAASTGVTKQLQRLAKVRRAARWQLRRPTRERVRAASTVHSFPQKNDLGKL
jgi:DIE2/ALG10 family